MTEEQTEPAIEVTEYTDPGSVWAWGAEPLLRVVRWRYGHLLHWRQVQIGMVDDVVAQAAAEGREIDPRRDVARFQQHFHEVHLTTGMPSPDPLRSMYRSTRPAALAVVAARRQSPELGERVLRRLREWLFVLGEPFDNKVALVAAISGVPGLDIDAYVAALDEPETLVAFQEDWEESRRPNAAVRQLEDDHPGHGRVRADGNRWRYAAPTIVMKGPQGEATVAGWRPLEAYENALDEVWPGVSALAAPPPTTDEAIAHWGTAVDVELATVCGPSSSDPTQAVRHDFGGGVLFLTEAEARARGLGDTAD